MRRGSLRPGTLGSASVHEGVQPSKETRPTGPGLGGPGGGLKEARRTPMEGSEPLTDTSKGAQNSNPELTVFYHRSLTGRSHGQDEYVRFLVPLLARRARVTMVRPPPLHAALISGAQGVSLAELASCHLAQLRHFLGRRRGAARAEVLVVFDIYGAILPMLFARLRGRRLVYVASDSWRELGPGLRRLRVRGSFALALLRPLLERALLRASDLVVARSVWMEESLAAQGIPRARLRVLHHHTPPPRHDTRAIAELAVRHRLAPGPVAVFIGNCDYEPNRRALRFIETVVSPHLAGELPTAKILVVGRGTQQEGRVMPPNVIGVGEVDDPTPYLCSASVGLAPISVPGGTSAKVVTYLTHGLRVLSTPEAAHGIISTSRLEVAELSRFAERLGGLLTETPAGGPGGPTDVDREILDTYVLTESAEETAREIAAESNGFPFPRPRGHPVPTIEGP